MEVKEEWKPVVFKFNHSWLNYEGLSELVKNTWVPFIEDVNDSALDHFIFNLKYLKGNFKKWEKEKLKMKNEDIIQIREDIE